MKSSRENRLKKPRQKPAKEAMLLKMATLCARSEQCPADIRKKLLVGGLSSIDSEEVINELRERKFLSEERFAGSFARDKVRFTAWGKLKIRKALQMKMIPSEIIDNALSAIPADDYKDALIRAARTKASSLNIADSADRIKLYRFLVTRGFEPSLASRLVKKIQAH